MSHMNRPTKRSGPLSGILMLLMLLTAIPLTAASAVSVPPPTGVDDTANIQAALTACVAQGPNCTVQLQSGKYLTKQLVAYNFRGTFKGLGRDQTTIEALPNLVVNDHQAGGDGEIPENYNRL